MYRKCVGVELREVEVGRLGLFCASLNWTGVRESRYPSIDLFIGLEWNGMNMLA